MTDKLPHLPQTYITQEQLDAIAGGECTVQQWQTFTAGLIKSYEDLIDFTSYMMERVAGP